MLVAGDAVGAVSCRAGDTGSEVWSLRGAVRGVAGGASGVAAIASSSSKAAEDDESVGAKDVLVAGGAVLSRELTLY